MRRLLARCAGPCPGPVRRLGKRCFRGLHRAERAADQMSHHSRPLEKVIGMQERRFAGCARGSQGSQMSSDDALFARSHSVWAPLALLLVC